MVLIEQGQSIADGNNAEILTRDGLSEVYQTDSHVSQNNDWYPCGPGQRAKP